MDKQPVSFPSWKESLAQAGLPPDRHSAYTREIIAFLRHCKSHRVPVSAELARQYLETRERQTTAPAREALRWFYRTARQQASEPHCSAVDPGRIVSHRSATGPSRPPPRQDAGRPRPGLSRKSVTH